MYQGCRALTFALARLSCHFLADNSLQSADKDQQESRAVTETVRTMQL